MDRRRPAHVALLLALSVVVALAAYAHADGGSTTIPTYGVKITPNWISAVDAPNNYNSVWVVGRSPTTPYRSPDSLHTQQRYLLLDPRTTDSDGRRGHDEWWFVIERLWPADYPADNHGRWGRQVNFHNVAGDSGPSGSGGVGWGFGTGVSALALDWWNGAPAPTFSVEPANNRYALPAVQRDKWHTYVVHWIAGRTDGTTVRPGLLQVWADGSNTPVIDAGNINTVQRAQGPDGQWYVQKWMQLWEGDYTQDLPVASRVQLALTRVGATLQEALDDRPSYAGDNASGQYYRGTGINLGAPETDSMAGRSPSDAAIPSNLSSTPAPPPPPLAPPVSTAPPTISGTPQAGQTLTTTNGSWSGEPTGYAYQWQRCNMSGGACSNIAAATAAGYTLTASDVGATLRAQVSATNGGGTTSAVSLPTATVTQAPQPKPSAPVNTAPPTITGTPQVGQTVTASTGTWSGDPTAYAYQWQRCNTSGAACANIAATAKSYAVTTGDVGATLRVQVKATNAAGSATAVSQPTATVAAPTTSPPAPAPTPPASTAPPTISGSAQAGKTLTAGKGSWDGAPTGYAYQWRRCTSNGGACNNVNGATATTYTVTAGDVGATLRVQVAATNAAGTTSATSQPTEAVTQPAAPPPALTAPVNTTPPTISGTAKVGETLTAGAGTWKGDPSGYAYQWQRCKPAGASCTDLEGATAASYSVTNVDDGSSLRVTVAASNAGGTTSAVSEPTREIKAPPGQDRKATKPDATSEPQLTPVQPVPEPEQPKPPRSTPDQAEPAPAPKGPDTSTDVTQTTSVRWDGEGFATATELRDHVEARGLDWPDFLRRHPSVVETYELPYVRWNGRSFFDDRDLASHLGTLGVPYWMWSVNHRPAAVMLEGQRES